MNFLAIFVVCTSQILIAGGKNKLVLVELHKVLNDVFLHSARPTLKSEIDEIFDLINTRTIREISREYSENDPSVQQLVRYLHSDEFQKAWNVFKTSSEVEDIFDWMRQHNVDVNRKVSKLSSEVEEITPIRRGSRDFSIRAFELELKQQIKSNEIDELISRFLKDGNDFAHLYLILQVSRPALEKLFERDEIKHAVESLKAYGADIDGLKVVVRHMLRWD